MVGFKYREGFIREEVCEYDRVIRMRMRGRFCPATGEDPLGTLGRMAG